MPGIFYEFIPFNEENFDAEGEVKPNPKSYMIHEVVEDVEYAVMLSTCAGAWRYLIGDVVKFTSVKEHEITIVGPYQTVPEPWRRAYEHR